MPADILNTIIEAKQARVAQAKLQRPLQQIRDQAFLTTVDRQQHALLASLRKPSSINIIAEFKRRSPSKGEIVANADPIAVAQAYERGGAAAMSVLTEENFFGGSLEELSSIRELVSLPLLRKDFIFEEYQVWESAAAGADALLLIVAALADEQLQILRELTEQLCMDALVEVHSEFELERAIAAGASLIGVNNRDLRTFKVSLEVSEKLIVGAPANAVMVSESGLHNHDDLTRLQNLGYRGFLIGESLMKAAQPEEELQRLMGHVN
jgi:indole-3-glycerol phosphate synthase